MKTELYAAASALVGFCLGLFAAVLYVEWREFELAYDMQQARSRAFAAEQDRDALLSGGRFVRLENPTRYVFKPSPNYQKVSAR